MVSSHSACGCAAGDPALTANRLTLNESTGPALSFRYKVRIFESYSLRRLGVGKNKVAAGRSPAAHAALALAGLGFDGWAFVFE